MALTQTTIQIKTGAGATVSVAAVTDGTNTYLLHGAVDTNGASITPAQDSTLQQATTALQQLAAALAGQIVNDAGTV